MAAHHHLLHHRQHHRPLHCRPLMSRTSRTRMPLGSRFLLSKRLDRSVHDLMFQRSRQLVIMKTASGFQFHSNFHRHCSQVLEGGNSRDVSDASLKTIRVILENSCVVSLSCMLMFVAVSVYILLLRFQCSCQVQVG